MTRSGSESVRTVRVDDVALTHVSAGESAKAPIVFVHGGCHGAWQWHDTQIGFGTSGRSSIAIDWFNHGQSMALPESEWIGRGIEAVQQEIDVAVRQSTAKPILIGHSMGGMASALYAAAHPTSIRALVLLTPVVAQRFAGEPVPIDIDETSPWGPPPPEVAHQLFYSTVVDDGVKADIYSRLQPESPRAAYEATRWTIDVEVDRIDVPALLLAGETDTLTPADSIARMADAMKATYVEVPECGHGVTFDPRWPSLCDDIETWLTTKARC